MKKLLFLMLTLGASFALFGDWEMSPKSYCCSRNCLPGKESPGVLLNVYNSPEQNKKYCTNYVKGYCGGEGYSCTYDSLTRDQQKLVQILQQEEQQGEPRAKQEAKVRSFDQSRYQYCIDHNLWQGHDEMGYCSDWATI